MALAREVQSVTPGHIELVSGMVPELERLGKKEQANELFDRAWPAHRKVLADYPSSNTARDALACSRSIAAASSTAVSSMRWRQ